MVHARFVVVVVLSVVTFTVAGKFHIFVLEVGEVGAIDGPFYSCGFYLFSRKGEKGSKPQH